MTDVTLVSGPPCSGKTTWVNNHKSNHDIVIDADSLAHTLGSPDTHGHLNHFWTYVRPMVQAAINTAETDTFAPHVWIIRTAPQPEQRHLWEGINVIVLEVDERTCRRRALDNNRPDEWADYIRKWWNEYTPDHRDTVIHG